MNYQREAKEIILKVQEAGMNEKELKLVEQLIINALERSAEDEAKSLVKFRNMLKRGLGI